ncbi:hypothetical protein N7474_011239 [Penicillium riverlandense]|uniref:uncharacterized protein n=1 Tax=Penicillium riverlandense TaxID=1903569 RepID=UPI00254895B6|nr:uncharacterized protein N7474_011239 [Penicillium riverlandense]KAJ5805352.1 hypothetical protein N7474_011239 [Penicillium riverlandense]
MNIYESKISDPSMVDLFCWSDWEASTIFRTTDVTATPTSGKMHSADSCTAVINIDNFFADTAPEALTTSTGIAPGAIITASSPSPTTTAAITAPNHSKPHESKTWIAGAVIGPIAGCALIGALGFWGRRRICAKKRLGTVEVPNPVQKFPSARVAVEIGTSGTQGIPELGPSSPKGLNSTSGSPAVELSESSR